MRLNRERDRGRLRTGTRDAARYAHPHGYDPVAAALAACGPILGTVLIVLSAAFLRS